MTEQDPLDQLDELVAAAGPEEAARALRLTVIRLHTCHACGHEYSRVDWWACPQCQAPSPDAIAEARKASKKKHPSNRALRSLLP